MFLNENINVVLHSTKGDFNIFLSQTKELYYSQVDSKAPSLIYTDNVLEFDADIDIHGNIGVVILDKVGRLKYLYFDGTDWKDNLLYKLDLSLEEFKHISIRFSMDSPYIMVCWRDLSNATLWSVLCYYRSRNVWKKKLFNRIHYKDEIKPYFMTCDDKSNIYLIYLKNYNMFYHIMFTCFLAPENRWSDDIHISNCIYLKYYQSDIIIDTNGIIHISWIDKYKKNFCVKYISFNMVTGLISQVQYLMEDPNPPIRQQLFCKNNIIAIYILTAQRLLVAGKYIEQDWNIEQISNMDKNNTQLVKYVVNHSKIVQHHIANYIFTNNSSPEPVETEFSTIRHQETENNKKDTLPSKVDEIYLEYYKIKQELESKVRVVNSLKEQNIFLHTEIERLNMENNKYLDIINRNSKNVKIYDENINKHAALLEQLKTTDQKICEILDRIIAYGPKVNIKQIDKQPKGNTVPKKEIKNSKGKNFFKKFFNIFLS